MLLPCWHNGLPALPLPWCTALAKHCLAANLWCKLLIGHCCANCSCQLANACLPAMLHACMIVEICSMPSILVVLSAYNQASHMHGLCGDGVNGVDSVDAVSGGCRRCRGCRVSGGVELCRCALTVLTLRAPCHCQDRLTLA